MTTSTCSVSNVCNTIPSLIAPAPIRLRRAFHELEAFQQSDQHEAAKRKLKETLAYPDTGPETPADN